MAVLVPRDAGLVLPRAGRCCSPYRWSRAAQRAAPFGSAAGAARCRAGACATGGPGSRPAPPSATPSGWSPGAWRSGSALAVRADVPAAARWSPRSRSRVHAGFFGDAAARGDRGRRRGAAARRSAGPAARVLASGAGRVLASASLWIYLTHWQVYPPLEDSGHQVLAILASLAVGVTAHAAITWAGRRVRTWRRAAPVLRRDAALRGPGSTARESRHDDRGSDHVGQDEAGLADEAVAQRDVRDARQDGQGHGDPVERRPAGVAGDRRCRPRSTAGPSARSWPAGWDRRRRSACGRPPGRRRLRRSRRRPLRRPSPGRASR